MLGRGLASLLLGPVMFVAFAAFLQLNNLAGQIYDSQLYIQTLREQDAYARFYDDVLLDEAVDRTARWVLGGTSVVIQEDLEPLLREILPPAYLQEQVEANVSRAIAYLNEEAETLNLYLELDPILDRIEPALFSYIDQQIDQTQVIRPDHNLSIPEQVAEVEALIPTLSRELAQGRLPQAVPSVENIPEAHRRQLADEFLRKIISHDALSPRIRRGLEENSPALRGQFVDGNTQQFLKEVARAVATPIVEEAIEETRLELDRKERLDLISIAAEGNPEVTEESFRRDIEEGRNQLNRFLSKGRLIALVIVIGSALAMAAVHLPNLAHSLRGPGLALLLTGLISYILSRALESGVANELGNAVRAALVESSEIPEAAAQLMADVTQAFALRLLEGMGNPALILVAIGALIFAGSFFVDRLRRDRTVR